MAGERPLVTEVRLKGLGDPAQGLKRETGSTEAVDHEALDELDAAVGSRKVRTRFVKSQPSHRRAKHVLAATADLADEIASSYAHETPGSSTRVTRSRDCAVETSGRRLTR